MLTNWKDRAEKAEAEVERLTSEQTELIAGHIKIELQQNADSAESLKITRDRAEKAEAEVDRLTAGLAEFTVMQEALKNSEADSLRLREEVDSAQHSSSVFAGLARIHKEDNQRLREALEGIRFDIGSNCHCHLLAECALKEQA